MLATYAMHLSLWQQRQTSALANSLQCLILTHHLEALSAVRDEIMLSTQSALNGSGGDQLQAYEGLVCTIVALACYAHLQGDLRAWKQHMNAADRILEQSCLARAKLSPRLWNLIEWYGFAFT